jgi:hypothetical protein
MQKVISGVVVKGYRVASGPSRDYPYGSLEKQIPLFKQRGLDLERFFFGTLNISIAPLAFEMFAPEYTFRQMEWTDLHPPEDFSFSQCKLRFKGYEYPGYIYYPHLETKKRHFEDNSILEIISLPIQEIQYGDRLEVDLNSEEVHILENRPSGSR